MENYCISLDIKIVSMKNRTIYRVPAYDEMVSKE